MSCDTFSIQIWVLINREYVKSAVIAFEFIAGTACFHMVFEWSFSKRDSALEGTLDWFCSRTFCYEMLVFICIAEATLATWLNTVELGLLEEVEVLSLDFLLFERLGTQWALITLLHPTIDAFLTVRSFTVFSTSNHVFRGDAGANSTDKLFHYSLVLLNRLIKCQFFLTDNTV